LEANGSGEGSKAYSCKYDKQISGFVKGGDIRNCVSHYYVLRKDSDPSN